MFSGRLRVPCSLQTLTRLSSGCRTNLDSSVNITLPASYTTACFAYFSTRNRGWLLPNIFPYFLLSVRQIPASLIQTGLRKLTFSSPCLTFGSECIFDVLPDHKLHAVLP
ncbi:hypothetical protein AVEN_1341-1 [Araneus ventricosus]|uniref:Uncharacterized protein n=1 Tax=Araneus ventricosus TaxID=182803 RepID=A0A4Y2D3X3_ARAVE|nr:hypothetical protein AVEN_1341-1 [Araneus ventricosus]